MNSTSKAMPPEREPRIYTRDEHNISRRQMSPNALKVLYRLNKAGFRACLVGGGVRDLLLGREPKDFDIATDAHPEQVRELFRNSRLIGRRFRLAHVRFGPEIIEVATFRAAHDDADNDAQSTNDGRILRDNVYGTIDDDVWRRDFTVNALYYDIADFSVIDYVGGVEDIEQGVMKLIGDPATRYREDPVRMLRAVRFAVKLGFRIDPSSEQAMFDLGDLLEAIAPARLFDETLKLFHGGVALQTFEALRHYGLFAHLFPEADAALAEPHPGFPATLIGRALENTDSRIAQNKPVTPAFLIAALLWEVVEQARTDLLARGVAEHEALESAADAVLSRQVARLAIPRRMTQMAREIWALQPRLLKATPKRAARLVEHPRFRAAYDFLALRAETGEPFAERVAWWTAYQETNGAEREGLAEGLTADPPNRRRRRRRRPADDSR